jgi:hypothetical protein
MSARPAGLESLRLGLDFGASHEPTIRPVQTRQCRPITAAKLDSKQQSKQEPIPPIRTRTVTRTAIRQMLAAAHGRRETQLLEKKRQRAACSARTRGLVLIGESKTS